MNKNILHLAILAAFISGCGGGSFDVITPPSQNDADTAQNTPPKFKEPDVKPDAGDDDNTERLEPLYGKNVRSPLVGWIYRNANGDIVQAQDNDYINQALIQDGKENEYNTLDYVLHPVDAGKSNHLTSKLDISDDGWRTNHSGAEDYGDYIHKPDGLTGTSTYLYANESYLKTYTLQHSKIGIALETYDGWSEQSPNIFFKAQDPSLVLPSGGTAKYLGVWDKVHASIPGSGDNGGYNTGLEWGKAEFNVNFGEKTVKGSLSPLTNHGGKKYAYDFSTELKGNRFSGDATPSPEASNDIGDALIEGGFYGNQGKEIAGYLLGKGDNANIFGTFAADQVETDSIVEGKLTPKSHSNAILVNPQAFAENITPVFIEDFKETVNANEKIADLNTVVINGIQFDLTTPQNKGTTFSYQDAFLPLSALRMGSVKVPHEDRETVAYFYQGTATQDMPSTATASYHGYWMGYGKSPSGLAYNVNKDSKAEVELNAHFGEKSITGKFFSPNGVLAMNMENGQIEGNTFSGVAHIRDSGLTMDDGNQNETRDDRIRGDVKVDGGFFGVGANELGGRFINDDKTFSGVFAGKEVAE